MEITWPPKAVYTARPDLWNQCLFENSNYVTQIVPNFREFLQWFLSSSTPSGGGGASVCGKQAEVNSSNINTLIIEDLGAVDSATGLFEVTATISSLASQILIEYGIDLSTPLKEELEKRGFTSTDDEYLHLLGGNMPGAYDGSTFHAFWDQHFYFLNVTLSSIHEVLYVFNQGDGSRMIPAMYFPEANKEDLANLVFLDFLFFDFDYWIQRGARFSFFQFSVDAEGQVNDNLSLFISNTAGVFSEQPRSSGGYVLPILYVDAKVQGRQLSILPGGFNQTVIPWTDTHEYYIQKTAAHNIFNIIPSTDAIVVNMYAYDHGNATRKPDVRYYDIERKKGVLPISLERAEQTLRKASSEPPSVPSSPSSGRMGNPGSNEFGRQDPSMTEYP